MAAGAADASHRITALTEDEGRAAAATTREALGSAGPLPRAERERRKEREEQQQVRQEVRQEVQQEVQRSTAAKECLVCGTLCGSQEKLRLHALTHAAGEKPFHCSQPHCCKAFSSKYKLFR